MSKRIAACVVAAVTRQSLMIADNLALDLTKDDLEYIYQSVGLFWLSEQIVPQAMINVKIYPFQITRKDGGESVEKKLEKAARHAIEIQKRYENE